MKSVIALGLVGPLLVFTAAPAPLGAAQAAAAPATATASLKVAELDQLMAPITLYPDELLIQVLTAATYPLEIVIAARWSAEPIRRRHDIGFRRRHRGQQQLLGVGPSELAHRRRQHQRQSLEPDQRQPDDDCRQYVAAQFGASRRGALSRCGDAAALRPAARRDHRPAPRLSRLPDLGNALEHAGNPSPGIHNAQARPAGSSSRNAASRAAPRPAAFDPGSGASARADSLRGRASRQQMGSFGSRSFGGASGPRGGGFRGGGFRR